MDDVAADIEVMIIIAQTCIMIVIIPYVEHFIKTLSRRLIRRLIRRTSARATCSRSTSLISARSRRRTGSRSDLARMCSTISSPRGLTSRPRCSFNSFVFDGASALVHDDSFASHPLPPHPSATRTLPSRGSLLLYGNQERHSPTQRSLRVWGHGRPASSREGSS